MPMRYLAMVIAIALTVACSQGPQLCPRYNFHAPYGFGTDWITNSDVVVAATITRVTRAGQHAWGEPSRVLTLYQVEFKPEHLLKGKLAGQNSFFVYLDESDLPRSLRPAFNMGTNQRSIFFLIQEGRVLRSIGDVLDYRLGLDGDPVTALQPPTSEYGTDHYTAVAGEPGNSQCAFSIAQLLLNPPAASNASRYVQHLANNVSMAETATSARYVVRLLREIIFSGKTAVAAAVCETLSYHYRGQSDCLKTTSGIREEVRIRIESRVSQRDAEDLRAFELNPMQGLIAVDSRVQILDQLELLKMSSNPRIHHLACQAIDRFYPEKHIERCVGLPPKSLRNR